MVAHKFILDFTDHIRKPIDLNMKYLVGHVHCELEGDGQICKHLAETGYERTLGARSLKRVIEEHVEAQLVDKYLRQDDEITESTNEGPLQKYTIRLDSKTTRGAVNQIAIVGNGETVSKVQETPQHQLRPKLAVRKSTKGKGHQSSDYEASFPDLPSSGSALREE